MKRSRCFQVIVISPTFRPQRFKQNYNSQHALPRKPLKLAQWRGGDWRGESPDSPNVENGRSVGGSRLFQRLTDIMASSVVKIISWTSMAVASSAFYFCTNKYLDPSDFGAIRFGRAIATTAVISYDYYFSLRKIPQDPKEYDEIKSKVHLRSAERLRKLCFANRGTFIKVGQHLASLEYLLPSEYTRTLKVLQSQAPQSPLEDIEQVIEEDLGKEIKDIFKSFDKTPLGTASLAQVHKAVLHDGRTVAVKVQHPKVQAQSSKDIMLMEMLVSAVKYLFPEFEFSWLVDEAKKNLILELDFLNEGRNAEKMAEMLKNVEALKIPKIYWELSTRRVLLMEFLEGGQINDKEYIVKNRIDVNEISQILGTMYSEMIFVHGFVHCDPHPGNLLVRKNATTRREEIILLDHGQYQVLTEEFRLNYCHLWQALINVDMENVKIYSQRLGAGDLYPLFACMLTARTWNSVTKGISQAPLTSRENQELQKNVTTYLPQISQLLNRVPRQTLLILKTNDLLRGIETTLCTRASASSFLIMSRCCTRALAEHRRKNTCSLLKKTQISVGESFCLWQINLHELFLRVKWSWLGNWVSTYLFWKSSSD
ncbi:aarF domain-containing protein kinase 1 [Monodelphis domestica]|uniref:aarF domain-containing protein kinase 1 n=1 Tax=Monodelphis domestica TaxID=13616 RepID=UPI0024E20DD6|nr:aarF domain-containing protein kinase 1 [Monodelphis domestica]